MKSILNLKYILSIVIFISVITGLSSQHVWPVQVTGSMIPPHSLDLKVYGTERLEDLLFNVTLMDPVEPTLDVRPVLTIEQNGSVIYQTDMNFSISPMQLTQFEPFTIDGSLLSTLLSNEALTTTNSQGRGSVILPEGLWNICLQMYGVERQVPVSNKFCIAANFRLNQAPQIIMPSFNEKIKLSPVQNMIFSWQPMHIGSGNNPGAVEYLFELVELPQGVMNANDVFESALKIYNTSTTSTSFIYSQAEPLLDPNKYYAWRVTASSIIYPTSRLFQNDGKSEISIFVLYDGDAPTSEINPFDNPSPRGCSVYETSYGPVDKADNESMIIGANQDVKLGYFKMKITEAIGDIQSGYSGKGLVIYPMLKSIIPVDFKKIKVNKEGRVFESEWIEATSGKFTLNEEQLKKENIAKHIGGKYAADLFNEMNEKSNQIHSFPENNFKQKSLPLALKNDKQPSIFSCITGIRFTPNSAYLNIIGLESPNSDNSKNVSSDELNISAATNIPATPYGMRSNAYLVSIQSASSGNSESPLQTILVASSQSSKNKLSCDCKGVYDINVSKSYIISPELMINNSNSQALTLELKDNSQAFTSYNGAFGAVPEFKIPGVRNISFNADGGTLKLIPGGTLDHSAEMKSLMPDLSHQGLLMKGLKATLPSMYNLGSGDQIVLDQGDLFIDNESIKYASISKNNVLALKEGRADKWQYSIDEMGIKIIDGIFSGPNIKGQLKLPIATDLIPYSGSFDINSNDNPSLSIDKKPSSLDVQMWKSKITLDSESTISAEIKNINNKNVLFPKAALHGVLSLQMNGEEFLNSVKGNSAEIKANLQSVFNIQSELNSVALEGIQIPNWNIDPNNIPEKKYQSGKIDVSKAGFLLNGTKFPITDAEVVLETKNNEERIGLRFSTVHNNSKMEFVIWAKDKGDEFVFDNIEQTKFILKCDCESGESLGWNESKQLLKYPLHDQIYQRTSGLASVNTNAQYSKGVYDLTLPPGKDTFKLINETTLYWPLIDKELKVTRPFKAIEFKDRILITPEIFTKLGFKTQYNIPAKSSLYISYLEITKLEGSKTKATIQFTLESQYDSKDDNKLMTFVSKKLEAKAKSIILKDIDLYLENATKVEDWDFKYYNWERKSPNEDGFNLARIDCNSGFKFFQMKGEVMLKDMLNKESNKEARIPFTLNTTQNNNIHSLIDFIAVCQDYIPRESSMKWNIHPKELPQVSFKAGDNYKIYFDHSTQGNSPKTTASKAYSKSVSDKVFKGLIFEKVQAELFGFKNSLKNLVALDIDDAVYVLGTADIDGFYANLEKGQLFPFNSGAKISGWKYGVDSVSFTIKQSKYESELSLVGSIGIPIFKSKPDKIKSVEFDSAIVKYEAAVYVDISNGESRVNSYFGFDDISTKIYQSDFIPGLGVVLNEDSNLSLEYHYGWKQWVPKGSFSGIGIILLTTETMKAYGLKNFPKGLDLSLHCLTFEGLKLNEESVSASEAFLDDYGIRSLEFGTWGVFDYNSSLGLNYLKSEKSENDQSENDQSKPTGSIGVTSTTSGKIVRNSLGVKSVSTASGKIIRTKSGTKVVSSASGSIKRTKNTNSAKTAAITAKVKTEPEFNSLKFAVNTSGVKATKDSKLELGISVSISMLGDNKENKGPNESVQTSALTAKGGFGLQFSKKDGKYIPEGVDFKCLALDGSIGPLEFTGGLSILSENRNFNSVQFGNGFKAYLSATILGLGGIQAVGQFGKTIDPSNEKFNYGFIDLEAFKQSGFAIPPGSPVIDLYGGGGGVRINMKSYNPISQINIKTDSKTMPSGDCPIPDARYLKPGVGLSQNYVPEKGTYGGNFYLIMGPWNELDNQDPPVYSIIADPGVDIQISTDRKTNELQFDKINVNINAYFKPESITKRRDHNIADAFVALELNLRDRILVGGFGARMKVDVPGMKSTLFQIPEDYESTKFEGKVNYVKGTLTYSFDNRGSKKPYFNFKFGGSSIGQFKSASGLAYNTALLNVEDKVKVKAQAYFQLGNEVDNIPPIKELIPQISDMESNQYATVKEDDAKSKLNSNGAGISFGFKCSMESQGSIGPLDGKLEVALGLNILMKEMENVSCSNSGPIGIKGWYAQGQAFGYANGNINLNYNFLFHSGRVNIMRVGGFILLKAKAPNPSNFTGRINGSISALNGLLSGQFNYKVELGKKCENLELPSPIEGLYIFNEANIADGQRNVDRYTDIIIGTNIPLNTDFNVPQVDKDGNPINTVKFQAQIQSIELSTNQNQVSVTQKIINNKAVLMTLNNPLLPNTEYQLKYSFIWKKWAEKDGKYQFIENFDIGKKRENNTEANIETGIIKFTTGDRPTRITQNMVEYMAPGDGQRYWHKGYANTEIKFKLIALEDAVSLFPDECAACSELVGSKVNFKYFVRLQEFDKNGKLGILRTIPITSYPSKSNTIEVLKTQSKAVGNAKYSITFLANEKVPVSEVKFPELKKLDLIPGAMYELSVIREPDIKDDNLNTIDKKKVNPKQTNQAEASSILTRNQLVLNKTIEKNKLLHLLQDHVQILHKSYFAVSNFSSLQDKLNSLSVKHVKSMIKRRDFQHPSDAFETQRASAISSIGESKFHSVKDDYYAFTTNNNFSEGFDQIDIMRLRRNIKLEYLDKYMPEHRIRHDRYGGKSKNEILDVWLASNTNYGNYIRKILYEYSKAESEGVALYGNSNISDGTKWHYKIEGANEDWYKRLQPNEIDAKKIINRPKYKSQLAPNYSAPIFEREVEYDFLLQDLRSRIIINQMSWLSKVSDPRNGYDNVSFKYSEHTRDFKNWMPGNYPEGDFLNDNRRFNNFDWVLFGDVMKNEKGDKYTYIASEPGYQFSYHGRSSISFPSSSDWNELIESKRDNYQNLNSIKEFSPNRSFGQVTENTISNPTELVENYWYKFKVDGKEIKVGNANERWTGYWGICFPYRDFTYGPGQYGIYSLGKGEMPTIRGFRNIKDPMEYYENIWNFSQEDGNMKVINQRHKGSNDDRWKNFPYVFRDRDFKDKGSVTPNPDDMPNRMEVIEMSGFNFKPGIFYKIGAEGMYLKDDLGSEKWTIIQEGSFFRFQSSNGFILKIDYYEKYNLLSANEKTWNLRVNDMNFPSDKYGDPNGYYRSVWAVVPVGDNTHYWIKNIRYPEYFLNGRDGKVRAIFTALGAVGDQIKIVEEK
jgi:hypothetical protein